MRSVSLKCACVLAAALCGAAFLAIAQDRSAADLNPNRELIRTRDQLNRAIAIARQYQEERALLREQLRESEGQVRELESQLEEARRQGSEEAEARAEMESKGEQVRDRVRGLESDLKEAEDRLLDRDRELAAVRRRLAEGVVPLEDAQRAAEAMAAAAAMAEEGNTRGAIRAYRDGLDSWPEHIGLRAGLAGCYYQAGDWKRARETARAIIDLEPNHPEALSLLGLVAWQEGDLREAARRLSQAVDVAPNAARYRVYHGIILFQRDRVDEARDVLAKALELDPGSADAAYNLAIAMASGRSPDLTAARQYYQTSLRLGGAPDPEFENALFPER